MKDGPNKMVADQDEPIAEYIQRMVAATNGKMYTGLVNRLREYPIPRFPLPPGSGSRLLDIGCGWGRWMVSAARAGFAPVGIDVKLEAVQAARDVLKAEGIRGYVAVADLRQLPFASGAFDTVWSYSVIQHVHRDWARSCIHEVHRCLAAGGQCCLEFPTKEGLWNRINRRRSTANENDPASWCVRYYSIQELRDLIEPEFGNFEYRSHCYFGIGIQPIDLKFVPLRYAPLILGSLLLSQSSRVLPGLKRLSDSVYVRAKKTGGPIPLESAAWPAGADNLELVPLLRCPLTHRPLHVSGSDALVTDDGSVSYPVVDGIPVLLAAEARRL
jgi:ubiquinone/menaquinone biosynthesis C-methylase UbiE/uncharacterized protein YbaR (Trm112 family)